MTRAVDAREASDLAVTFAGVIFAGGPRSLTDDQARAVLDALSASIRKVGVMGRAAPAALAQRGRTLRLDVIQMHGDPTPQDVERLRAEWAGEIWAVVRTGDANMQEIADLFSRADAVLLDSGVKGTPGGTGVSFSWESLELPAAVRASGKLILAGGLSPDNVAHAIRTVRPDTVDVSSGIESAPGVKDHEKMRAFVTSVRSVSGE